MILAVVAVLAALLFAWRRRLPGERLSPLAAAAFVLVIAGIVFVELGWVRYVLLGAAGVLAIVDIVRRGRRSPQ